MKVTAKIAASQLKVNHTRSFWTVMGIILATSLTTCVCSLVASGNKMLVTLLGVSYGEYRDAYTGMLLIPALLLAIIIFAMTVIVISNVFRISTRERIAEFGTLKCVGATGLQIKEIVMYESVFFSVIAIPIGMIFGLFLTYMAIYFLNIFLAELNTLTNIMVREIHFSMSFVVSLKALGIAMIISFFTVIVSAYLPAKKAAKESAVDSIRGNETIKAALSKKRKDNSSNTVIKHLFGAEGCMAYKNLKRNGKNFKATVTALTIGIILFITLESLSNQAVALQNIIYPDDKKSVMADYTSARITQINDKTGLEESINLQPIDSELGNQIKKELEAYDGESVFGFGMEYELYDTKIESKFITEDMILANQLQKQDEYTFDVELIVIDTEHYKELCKKANVKEGSAILLNYFNYNDNGYVKDIVPFSKDMEQIVLYQADGSSESISLGGMITKEDIPEELFYVNTNPVRLIVPKAIVRGYTWENEPKDVEGYITFANQVMAKNFPNENEDSYMKSGFNTSVFRSSDFAKVMNIAIVIVSFFMYGFAILLMLIGFTNVISTLTTNVLMRAREFAVLRSIGMTLEGVQKMLTLESIFCSFRAVAVGVPIGCLCTYLINMPIRRMFPIPYQFPIAAVLICSCSVFILTLIITRLAARRLRKQNIIEAIRAESD